MRFLDSDAATPARHAKKLSPNFFATVTSDVPHALAACVSRNRLYVCGFHRREGHAKALTQNF